MSLAPIILFVYKRPEHTKKVLEALTANPLAQQSTLYIFSDGPKNDATPLDLTNILNTRKIIASQQWCKEIHLHHEPVNKGLAASILEGVTAIVNQHQKVIVLEDDITVSPYFLNYMNDALTLYANETKVMHISSYLPSRKDDKHLPETFFLRFMSCWGWGTWARAWQHLETDTNHLQQALLKRKDKKRFSLGNAIGLRRQLKHNQVGLINTWAIKWYTTIFLTNGLCLYPKQSLSAQIGMDGTGEHCIQDELSLYAVELSRKINVQRISIEESKLGYQYLRNFYLYGKFTGIAAIVYRLKILKNRLLY